MSDILSKFNKEKMLNVKKVRQVMLQDLCRQNLRQKIIRYEISISCDKNSFLKICKRNSAKLIDENVLQQNYILPGKHNFFFNL